MKKMIAATAVAASVAVGGIAGVALGVPTIASAQNAAEETVTWIDEALSGLVTNGTINQAQADAVESALEEAKPDRGPRGGRIARHFAMDTVAGALGMTNTELRAALAEDKTIAEVASDRGVEVQAVIDALVSEHKTHLDEHVAAGDITQEQADERLANFTEHATALVNGEAPLFKRHHGPRGFGGPRGGMAPAEQPSGDADETAA